MVKCLRCGQCCVLLTKNREIKGMCRFLKLQENGRTRCTVYRTRLLRTLDKENWCTWRNDTFYDFEGCPYNTDKPLIKVNVKELIK